MKKLSKFVPRMVRNVSVFVLVFVSVYGSSGISDALATTIATDDKCVVVDTLSDSESQAIGSSPELTVSTIISNKGLMVGEQKEYQVWGTNQADTEVRVTFLDGYTSAGDVFGYYKKGDTSSFVPLFKNGTGANSTYSVDQATLGQTFTFSLPAGEYGFAIHTELEESSAFRTSENSLNDGGDHMIAYDVAFYTEPNYGRYVLGFEDLPMDVSDKDYNDIVVKVEIMSCEQACEENALVSIVENLPGVMNPGQTYSFTVKAENTGDTKWYHGSYFQLISTEGNLSINPTYGHLPNIMFPGDSTTWTFDVTATTTPGNYSTTLQMVHKTGAEYRDANFVECAPSPSADTLFGNAVTATTTVSEPIVVPPTPTYCLDGVTLTSDEFRNAVSNGLISYNLATNTEETLAIFTITNTTNCKAPISLSSYKVFDTTLSHQEFYDGSGLVNATSSTVIYADLPSCMAQIDAWYGLHPENLLDTDPYTHPNIPNVLAFMFIQNSGTGYWDAQGNFCQKNATNTPPVITLIGANPATVNVGETFVDPGATAMDLEDGDITEDIVASSTVNTAVAGSYEVTYNVSDSQGLPATPVTRTVNVVGGTSGVGGSITFCLVLGDKDNTLATSSYSLPTGTFSVDLATSTLFGSSTINSKNWSSSTFSPNVKTILSVNDSECVTFGNLDIGNYYYSELAINGSQWNTPKYSDQDIQPVNSIFDLFAYSPELFNATSTDDELRNTNADGHIILDSHRKDRTVILYSKYEPASGCTTNCGGGGSTPTANISVVKTSDVSTANVNNTVNYTITVTNAGPNEAVNVTLTDIIPSELTFVSATSTQGTYATTTGIWTIGTLGNNASTTLSISATINAGSEGKTIVNTATATSTVSDPDSINNTSTVNIVVNNPVVNPPACTSNCGGGGGGGGGGGNGPIVGSFGVGGGSVVPPVVVTPPSSCYYLYDFLRADFDNNPVEVTKLQVFLRDLEGFTDVQITGIYDAQTIVALDAFQSRYAEDILTPWGHTAPTSYTYILTKKKVNEIYCKMAFPVTPLEQLEIDTYRNFLESLKSQGIYIDSGVGGSQENPTYPSTPSSSESTTTVGQVGTNATSTGSAILTLAGFSSTTQKMLGDLTANAVSAGKELYDSIAGFIKGIFGDDSQSNDQCDIECDSDSGLSGWINLILILVIVTMAYLWYRQYQNNKKLEIINKEIDLQ